MDTRPPAPGSHLVALDEEIQPLSERYGTFAGQMILRASSLDAQSSPLLRAVDLVQRRNLELSQEMGTLEWLWYAVVTLMLLLIGGFFRRYLGKTEPGRHGLRRTATGLTAPANHQNAARAPDHISDGKIRKEEAQRPAAVLKPIAANSRTRSNPIG